MSLDDNIVSKIISRKLKLDNFQLKKYVCKNLETSGIMGDHFKLICNVLIEDSLTPVKHCFFIKKKAPHEKNLTTELCDQVFAKEIAAYHVFKQINSPMLNSALAKCFYTDAEQLILENLVIDGYKTLQINPVATENELFVVLETLTCIHAASIVYEEQQSNRNLVPKSFRLNEQFPEAFVEVYLDRHKLVMQNFHNALMKGVVTATRVFNLPELLKNGRLLKDEIHRFWDIYEHGIAAKPSIKFRNVMCHSDLWPANILMKYNEDGKPQHAKIIDFQITRYLPPAFDVLIYILLNTTKDYRQKNMWKLQLFYYDSFCKNLENCGVNSEDILTFSDLFDSFKEIEILAIYIALYTITLVYNCDINAKEYLNSEVHIQSVLGDQSSLFTDFASNKFYMSRVRDALLDVVEYLENN